MSFLLITITVSFQHECSNEFVKEYVSPVNIMKGRVSLIIMNFNEWFNIMKGVYYQLLLSYQYHYMTQYDVVGGWVET